MDIIRINLDGLFLRIDKKGKSFKAGEYSIDSMPKEIIEIAKLGETYIDQTTQERKRIAEIIRSAEPVKKEIVESVVEKVIVENKVEPIIEKADNKRGRKPNITIEEK